MNKKYHLTPDGPKECHAEKGRCRFSGNHYDNLTEANEAFDSRNKKELGYLPSLKRDREKKNKELDKELIRRGFTFDEQTSEPNFNYDATYNVVDEGIGFGEAWGAPFYDKRMVREYEVTSIEGLDGKKDKELFDRLSEQLLDYFQEEDEYNGFNDDPYYGYED